MFYPVILAGGVGSRLWPLSRSALPKQFVQFPRQSGSLFQETLRRLQGLEEMGPAVVVCNAEHRFLVAEQLRQLGMDGATILLEPVGRNTAPAVAMAALHLARKDPEARLLVLPSDHLIREQKTFQDVLRAGLELTESGRLVTFGIVPGGPETGFGYIQQGEPIETSPAYSISRFVEKPDLVTAEGYIASGDYVWNSGMFLFRADAFLSELGQHAGDILASCEQATAGLESGSEFISIPEAEFAACRSESIDYAVMEHTQAGAVLPLDAGWSDLGSWDALWSAEHHDDDGNVMIGDVMAEAMSNSYIQSQSRLVAAVGMQDTVIVETPDAVLVANKAAAQSVKGLVERLQLAGRQESVTHTRVPRPWGHYQSLAEGKGFQVKHIVVTPGSALSLQLHHKRSEHWTVIHGTARVHCDDRDFDLAVNESTFIPVGAMHRLANQQDEPLEIIEVQVGEYLGEDDIVRFDDLYGRASEG